MNLQFKTNPNPSSEDLRELFSNAWGRCDDKDFAKILAHGLAHICAYDGEKLVGFVNIAWDGDKHAFILDTSVHEDYQRCGIATKLVKQATETAQLAGAEWLHVDFAPHLTSFYQKCGFKPTAAGLIKL